MPLPTLDDFKTHLNVVTKTDDAEMQDVLAAAVDVVEGIVGPLRSKTVIETHYDVHAPYLVLRQPLASAVVDVSVGLVPYVASDYLYDAQLGVLRMLNGRWFSGTVTVTYTAGFDTVPSAVNLATLMIGKQMWDTQRGAQPQAVMGGGEAPQMAPMYGSGIPPRAEVLLQPFSRGPGVA